LIVNQGSTVRTIEAVAGGGKTLAIIVMAAVEAVDKWYGVNSSVHRAILLGDLGDNCDYQSG
jgi:hypothetical protein